VNAVYAKKIAELESSERQAFVQDKREEYEADIDIYHLASELIVDGIVPANSLRNELMERFEAYSTKYMVFSERKHPVHPV